MNKLTDKLTPDQSVIFKNVNIIDPSQDLDKKADILLKNRKIIDITQYKENIENAIIIDCENLVLSPGLVDIYSQVKSIDKDYIENFSNRAAAGGITTSIISPQTSHIIDTPELIELFKSRTQNCKTNMLITGALSIGLSGEAMAEYGLMKQSGAICLSNGNKFVQNPAILKQFMTYAKNFDLLVMHHPQDQSFSTTIKDTIFTYKNVSNNSLTSFLGIDGIDEDAEIIALHRDICLANNTQATYHAQIISTKEACNIIKAAKLINPNISASTSIYNISFNENDIGEYDTVYKATPPLRSEETRQHLIEALLDGTIDAIVSSNDDSGEEIQTEPFANSKKPNLGIELLFPLAMRLYHNKSLSLIKIIELLSTKPAKILNLKAGSLDKSNPADFIIFDPNSPVIINKNALQGKIIYSFVNGELVFSGE